MVTLAGTQNLNEFELHLRAVLGLPIPNIKLERMGVSAVILSDIAAEAAPQYAGLEEAVKRTTLTFVSSVNPLPVSTAGWEWRSATHLWEAIWMPCVIKPNELPQW